MSIKVLLLLLLKFTIYADYEHLSVYVEFSVFIVCHNHHGQSF